MTSHGYEVDLAGVARPGVVGVRDQLGEADDLAGGFSDELDDASWRRQPLARLLERRLRDPHRPA